MARKVLADISVSPVRNGFRHNDVHHVYISRAIVFSSYSNRSLLRICRKSF